MKFLIAAVIFSLFFLRPCHADITTGLVGWWKFDEGSGTSAADSSGNSNTGTVNGATWVAGKRGPYALNFNGTTVTASASASLDLTGSTVTVAAWVKASSVQGCEVAMKYDSIAASIAYGYQLWSDGFAYYHVNTSTSWKEIRGASTYSTNKWHHLATTYDGSTLKGYLNGSVDVSAAHTGTLTGNNSKPLTIGNSCINVVIDDVRVYNRALSASDIAELYTSRTGKFNNAHLNNFKNAQ